MPSKSKKVKKGKKVKKVINKCIITELLQIGGVLVCGTTKTHWVVQSQLQLANNADADTEEGRKAPRFRVQANSKNISEIPKCLKNVHNLLYKVEKVFKDKNGKKTGMCKYAGFPGIEKYDTSSLCNI
jgi:hypothetical protein